VSKPSGLSILVVPDAHARPDVGNERFDALGNFIACKRPDIVVSIGDWADMPSLCSYDKGKRAAEGRRYQDDIDSSVDALERTMSRVNAGYRLSRRKKPAFHITLGNHEERILRATEYSPELYGKLTMSDLKFEKYGWSVHPFLDPLVLQGICFKHYFTSGVMGRPVGGVNHARTLVLKNYQSSVCGHSHSRDFWEDTRADGQKVFGLVVGCYDEKDQVEWTQESKRWWSGLVMLHEAEDGQAEPAFYSMDYVKRKYL
jgi:hypothetical protein